MIEPISTDGVDARPVFINATENEKPRIPAEQILPLYSEEVSVSKRRVDQAVIRVTTVTHRHETVVNEQLTHEHVEVERVPVGRVIEMVPPIREEGGITIIPVVEEILVVERRLVLKEEVHLRKIRVTEQYQETVDVREQDAVITRIEAGVNLII